MARVDEKGQNDESHTRSFKSSQAPFLGDSSSPLSSISIPSPPSISPTPEMYNKQQHLYHNVSQLEVQNQFVNNVGIFNEEELSNGNATNANPIYYSNQRRSNVIDSDSCISTPKKSHSNYQKIQEAVTKIRALKDFLLTAPNLFKSSNDFIIQFKLPTEEKISCVYWDGLCITGTDIVRILAYRFSLFGRDIVNRKKFEEGVFSDLRNLKINIDARLENPKSELLEYLYKRHCVRTKKKQKVFYWYSVRHDQLFIDALERELKKEVVMSSDINQLHSATSSGTSTMAVREPALSLKYDASLPLTEQLISLGEKMRHEYGDLVTELISSTFVPAGDHLTMLPTNVPNGAHRQTSTPSLHTPESTNLTSYKDNLVFRGDQKNSYKQETLQPPFTPTQQMISGGQDTSMLTPFEKSGYGSNKLDLNGSEFVAQRSQESQQQFQLQHSDENHLSAPNYDKYNKSVYQTPPHNNSPMRIEHDGRYISSSVPKQNSMNIASEKYSDDVDSDFPLFDILTKMDASSDKPSEANQTFETRYMDFAHYNRPALSLQNNGNPLLIHDGPASPYAPSSGLESSLLSYNYPNQNSYSLLGGGYLQPPQGQLSDWDQYIYADSRDISHRTSEAELISENEYGGFNIPLSPHGSSFVSSARAYDRDPLMTRYADSWSNSRVSKPSSYSRKKSNTQQPSYLSYINEEF